MRRQQLKFRPHKLPRPYLDENFPLECIKNFSKFNTKHAVLDFDYAEREDRFHFDFAIKAKRILITLDRDYENDVKYKLPETFGIIIISAPSPTTPARITEISRKLVGLLIGFKDNSLQGAKISATIDGWSVRYIKNGQKIKNHYSWKQIVATIM